MESQTYHETRDKDGIKKLRKILMEMPTYVKDYFRAIDSKTSILTRIGYANDVKIFFQFLRKNNPAFGNIPTSEIPFEYLDCLQAVDIEEYMEYLKLYEDDEGIERTNSSSGIARKLSSLKSLFTYFNKREMLRGNPVTLVYRPKLNEKAVTKLDADEVANLLDYIESYGNGLDGQKKRYFEKTKLRDFTVFTVFLGTGIRVSELVGLDVSDVDFKNSRLRIVRKGGNEAYVYFGLEVEDVLSKYMKEQRSKITPISGHENALFLSTRKKRMGVSTVEEMVKKYTKGIIPNKHITPHKLRSTFGTALYHETGDIFLVADVLGHKDVNTTKKHYTKMDDSRRKAVQSLRLREE